MAPGVLFPERFRMVLNFWSSQYNFGRIIDGVGMVGGWKMGGKRGLSGVLDELVLHADGCLLEQLEFLFIASIKYKYISHHL